MQAMHSLRASHSHTTHQKESCCENKKQQIFKALLIAGLAVLILGTLAAAALFTFGGSLVVASIAASTITKAITTVTLTTVGKAALSSLALALGGGLLSITAAVLNKNHSK